MTKHAALSIGVAAAVGPELARALAPAIETAGFAAMWVNDTPDADALAVIEAAAGVTTRLVLATGVLPIDRRSATAIAADVRARGLPQHRLLLGIGAGQLREGALQRVGDAASALRSELEARVLVGALGPKMRRLAATESDGPLLSWLTPEIAREQSSAAHRLTPSAHVALYVRAALDEAGRAALRQETARYASVPAYATNFERQGISADRTVLDAASGAVAARLDDYRTGPDEVVLRAITESGTLDDHLRFVESARALL